MWHRRRLMFVTFKRLKGNKMTKINGQEKSHLSAALNILEGQEAISLI